jgi:hypothetical protein
MWRVVVCDQPTSSDEQAIAGAELQARENNNKNVISAMSVQLYETFIPPPPAPFFKTMKAGCPTVCSLNVLCCCTLQSLRQFVLIIRQSKSTF